RGLLCHCAHANGTRLATLVAVSSSFVSRPARVVPGRRYALSRFAYLGRQRGEAGRGSPSAPPPVILHGGPGAAPLRPPAAGAAGATAEELTQRAGGLPESAVTGVVALLLRAGLLGEAGAEEDAATQTWEFHDLLFHARSRTGRSDAPHGATYRMAGRLGPPP